MKFSKQRAERPLLFGPDTFTLKLNNSKNDDKKKIRGLHIKSNFVKCQLIIFSLRKITKTPDAIYITAVITSTDATPTRCHIDKMR